MYIGVMHRCIMSGVVRATVTRIRYNYHECAAFVSETWPSEAKRGYTLVITAIIGPVIEP